MQRVFNAGLLFLHLALGCSADVNLRHTTSQLGQPLFEFFTIVVAGGIVDFAADLFDSRLDIVLLATALDDRGVVLVNNHLLGTTQLGQAEALKLHAQVFENTRGTRQHGNVFEHGLAPVAVARGLHSADVESATQFIDHERCQCLAINFLADNQQRLAGIHNSFQQRHDVFHAGNFLLVDQDVAIFEHALHLLRIGDEVGGEIAAVKLHPLDPLHLSLEALAFVDSDHAILANFVHGLG